jgi:hypothetical protein
MSRITAGLWLRRAAALRDASQEPNHRRILVNALSQSCKITTVKSVVWMRSVR